MTGNDPTDHALAVIASIFEKPDDSQTVVAVDSVPAPATAPDPEPASPEVAGVPGVPGDLDGYCRFGPGPLNALRFKWQVRRGDDGMYYVDETIGDSSRPISSGPLQHEQAIAFIDEREHEILRRFDTLRHEIGPSSSERGSSDNNPGGGV